MGETSFEPTLTAKLAIRKLANTPGEPVTVMTEMDKKIRMVEELIPLKDGKLCLLEPAQEERSGGYHGANHSAAHGDAPRR